MTEGNSKENGVGYGKPPVASQFQKGTSGNPGGKKKGTKSKATLARAALDRSVKLKIDGKLRRISMEELGFRTLGAKAGQGDIKALKQLLEWCGDGQPEETPEYPEYEVTLVLEEDDPRQQRTI